MARFVGEMFLPDFPSNRGWLVMIRMRDLGAGDPSCPVSPKQLKELADRKISSSYLDAVLTVLCRDGWVCKQGHATYVLTGRGKELVFMKEIY